MRDLQVLERVTELCLLSCTPEQLAAWMQLRVHITEARGLSSEQTQTEATAVRAGMDVWYVGQSGPGTAGPVTRIAYNPGNLQFMEPPGVTIWFDDDRWLWIPISAITEVHWRRVPLNAPPE